MRTSMIALLFTTMFMFACSDSENEANGTKDKCSSVTCEKAYMTCNADTGVCEGERFVIDGEFILDHETKLMWQNANIEHNDRDYGIQTCENSTMKGHDDWRLSDAKTLGVFHFETNKAGIVPKQAFDRCLAEFGTDGYVKTKKGSVDYGGNPGDPFGFSGPANFRCVRNFK